EAVAAFDRGLIARSPDDEERCTEEPKGSGRVWHGPRIPRRPRVCQVVKRQTPNSKLLEFGAWCLTSHLDENQILRWSPERIRACDDEWSLECRAFAKRNVGIPQVLTRNQAIPLAGIRHRNHVRGALVDRRED